LNSHHQKKKKLSVQCSREVLLQKKCNALRIQVFPQRDCFFSKKEKGKRKNIEKAVKEIMNFNINLARSTVALETQCASRRKIQ